jgi:Ca-activated chloride channel family protein
MGAALGAALDAFDGQEPEEGRTIVLFSDGEDHGRKLGGDRKSSRQARVIVHSIAVGDPGTGHPVPSGRDTESLTYRGAPVLSRRSDSRFQDLSKATGGVVVPLGLASLDLGILYETRIARAEAQQRSARRSLERAERFPPFVLAALVFGWLVRLRSSVAVDGPACWSSRSRPPRWGREGEQVGSRGRFLGSTRVRIGAIPRSARRLRASDRARPGRGDRPL